MADLDSLQIKISADASSASRQLEVLSRKLTSLSQSLSAINTGSLSSLSAGISQLSSAVNSFANSTKTTDFSRIRDNISSLNNANISNINSISSALGTLASSVSGISGLSGQGQQVSDLVQALGGFGRKSITTSIANIPRLTNELVAMITALSKAPAVSSNVTRLISSLSNFNVASRNVGTSAQTASKGFKDLQVASESSANGITKLAVAFGKLYASLFWIKRLGNSLWKSIKSSMGYVEVLNYFNKAFGQVGERAVEKFGEAGKKSAEAYYNSFVNSAKGVTSEMSGYAIENSGYLSATGGSSLGLDPTKLMNYQATFAQMSSSMGVASAQAGRLSEVLVKIGADLASVKNLDFESVWDNMASGLVGMSRTLDKYGVNIRNANMQQKLFELGIEANITKLGQNDKALLRTIILLDSAKYAWGDLSQTLDQPANQLRMLQSGFSNLARTIGNIFLPIVAKVLPYINAMVIALQRLANWIAKLLGVKFDWGLGSGSGDSSYISDIADEAENASGAMDDASSSAKKLKKSVMGFDELNQLSDKSDSGSGAGGLGAVGSGLLNDAFNDAVDEYLKAWDEAYAKLKNKAQRIADAIIDAFKRGDYEGIGNYISTNLSRALNKIPWNKIYNVASKFGTGLAQFLNGLITPTLFDSIGRTIANALNTQLKFAVNFAKTLRWGQMGESIASGINSFFRNYNFKDLAEAFNTFADGLWEMMKGVFANLDWKVIFQGLKDFFTNLDFGGWMLLLLTKAPKIISLLAKIGGKIALLKTNFGALKGGIVKIGEVFATVTSKIKGLFTGIRNFLINVDTFGSFGEALKYLSKSISPVTKAFSGLIAVITEFISVKNVAHDLTAGESAGFLEWASAIAGAVAELGTLAIVLGSLPLAIAGTAITVLTGAWVGYAQATREAIDTDLGNKLKESLTVSGGVPIDEYISSVTDKMYGVRDSFDKISDASSGLSTAKSNIENTANSIALIETKMSSGVLSTEEGVEQLKKAFEDLSTSASTQFEALENTLMLAFGEGGALHSVFESLGINTDETMQAVTRAYDSAEKRIAEITEELAKLDPSTDKYIELKQELYNLVGQTDETSQAVNDFKKEIDGFKDVDWGELDVGNKLDTTALTSQLAEVTGAMSSTTESIKSSSKDIENALNDAFVKAVSPEDKKVIEEAMNALPEAMDSVKEDVAVKGLEFSNALQEHYVGQISKVTEDALAEWEKLNPAEKLATGFTDAESFAYDAVQSYQKNFIDPLSDEIEKQYEELGIEGAGWAKSSSQDIIDGMFDVDYKTHSAKLATDYEQVYKDGFDKAKTNSKKIANENGKYVIGGVLESVEKADATSSIGTFFDNMWKKFCEKFGIASPAKEMYPLGNYITLGIVEGFKEKFDEFNTAISDFMENTVKPWFDSDKWTFDGIKEGLKSSFDGAIKGIKEIWNGFVDALNEKLTFTLDPIKIMGKTVYEGGTINLGKLPKFAKGGMVEDGLFMANHGELVGQFSNGKTAVANNEMIISGIKQGVYEAVATAMSTSNNNSGSYINNTIQIDGETIARAVTKGQNSIARRYSPTMA